MALHPEYEAFHSALLERIFAEGIERDMVMFHVVRARREDRGRYWPSYGRTGLPKIEIYRSQRAESVDDYLTEIGALAHEFGHHLSSKRSLRTAGYERALDLFDKNGGARGSMTDEEARLILEEESRAWEFALVVLQEIEFPERAAVEVQRDEALAVYRTRLAL